MAKFKVMVLRAGYASREIEVDADNKIQAELRALDDAGNYEFSEHDCEYEVDSIEEVKECSQKKN
jgi:hypothetical protein